MAGYPAVTCSPTAAHDGPKGYAIMRGCTVRGSSCPSDLKRARRQARQEAIEMARGEALGQAIADDSRHVRYGAIALVGLSHRGRRGPHGRPKVAVTAPRPVNGYRAMTTRLVFCC
jgi:hypothetical protein